MIAYLPSIELRFSCLRGLLLIPVLLSGCADDRSAADGTEAGLDTMSVITEITDAVWRFHAADTTRDASAVINLLWPEFTMLADGNRLDYESVASGSEEFLSSLETFHTVWTDLSVVPLTSETAVSSFHFRDSIVTKKGDLIQSQGPTTFVWQKRNEEWRLIFADADHYPLQEK